MHTANIYDAYDIYAAYVPYEKGVCDMHGLYASFLAPVGISTTLHTETGGMLFLAWRDSVPCILPQQSTALQCVVSWSFMTRLFLKDI
ncbi:hypothetical protein M513_12325 [Trichuris suis]|uniref:Uncharacterized protein n=1 Tax=Trichuris suis TaxID=68888 RepID=A0A085LPA1_9BILA|nr:hypothetical protein M513_12325 [Trichuris suis]